MHVTPTPPMPHRTPDPPRIERNPPPPPKQPEPAPMDHDGDRDGGHVDVRA
jgi:hypothetical protein